MEVQIKRYITECVDCIDFRGYTDEPITCSCGEASKEVINRLDIKEYVQEALLELRTIDMELLENSKAYTPSVLVEVMIKMMTTIQEAVESEK